MLLASANTSLGAPAYSLACSSQRGQHQNHDVGPGCLRSDGARLLAPALPDHLLYLALTSAVHLSLASPDKASHFSLSA